CAPVVSRSRPSNPAPRVGPAGRHSGVDSRHPIAPGAPPHVSSILERLTGPGDLRGLDEGQLAILAAELRETIIGTVAKTGGHLGSSLGVVELTLALHRLLESPRDPVGLDHGDPAYAPKRPPR